VRMAVGAQPGQVARLVLWQGARLAFAGIIPGVLLAYAAGRSLQALLAGVSPGDPRTFVLVVGLVLVMTVAGTLLPVRRALRVDPVRALRGCD
jgi:putative ABC transport system permease protein